MILISIISLFVCNVLFVLFIACVFYSYTLEGNYNSGRQVNSLSPATMDDGRATPPPLAGFPPRFTIAMYEEVIGKCV